MESWLGAQGRLLPLEREGLGLVPSTYADSVLASEGGSSYMVHIHAHPGTHMNRKNERKEM